MENIYVITNCQWNTLILNILNSIIPKETLQADDKEPPWLTNKIKKLINEKKNTSLSINVKIAKIYKY